MKIKTLTAAILAASFVAGPSAFAQGNGPEFSRGNPHQGQGQGPRHEGPGRNGRAGDPGRPGGFDHRAGGGAGPDHAYFRGDRMPPYYRSHQFVVDDWRGHNLRQPPRGYHWVQSGGDYVLVAIATGIILELLLSH